MREPPPDRILSPDGKSGWYAHPPEGFRPDDDDDRWEGSRRGTLIRFMAEVTVDVPLARLNRLLNEEMGGAFLIVYKP